MKSSILLLLAATSLFASPTLETKTGQRAPIHIIDGIGQMEIRTVVVDNGTKPRTPLKPVEESAPEAGADVTRTDTFEFSDGTKGTHTAKAKVVDSDVIVQGSWKATGPAKGFIYRSVWVPKDVASDLVIEHDGSPVFPGVDGYLKLKTPGPFIFRQQSTGQFLFKVTGDYAGATIEFHEGNPQWGLHLHLERETKSRNSVLSESGEMNWNISFKE